MSTLISDCLSYNKASMMDCMLTVDAAPSSPGGLPGAPVISCLDYEKKDMLECLTGVGGNCCYVVGMAWCPVLINGVPFSIFNNG